MRPNRYRDMRTRLLANSFSLVGYGGGCILWLGKQNSNGYGWVQVWDRQLGRPKNAMVHVVMWELVHRRSVREGYELDHTCVRPLCFNPAHLDEVTHWENVQRIYERRDNRLRTAPRVETVEFSPEQDAEFAAIMAGAG